MLATLMGTLVMARVTGSGDASDEILGAGREAALAIATGLGPAGKTSARPAAKPRVSKAPTARG